MIRLTRFGLIWLPSHLRISSHIVSSGSGYYVNYYTSRLGFTLSASLKRDYWGWGYNNAPGTTNGDPTYNFPTYAGLPTTPDSRMPEPALDRMLPVRRGFTLTLFRESERTRERARSRHPTRPHAACTPTRPHAFARHPPPPALPPA